MIITGNKFCYKYIRNIVLLTWIFLVGVSMELEFRGPMSTPSRSEASCCGAGFSFSVGATGACSCVGEASFFAKSSCNFSLFYKKILFYSFNLFFFPVRQFTTKANYIITMEIIEMLIAQK